MVSAWIIHELKGDDDHVSCCRKVRHKNIVQFIGACTQPPNLCIVTGTLSKAIDVHVRLQIKSSVAPTSKAGSLI
jgi:hypothetical protein